MNNIRNGLADSLKAKCNLYCIIFLISVYSQSIFAQVPIAPSVRPLESADRGMNAEINQLKQYIESHKGDVDAMEEFTQGHIAHKNTNGPPDTSCIVTIPVVFHVFHPDGSAGVPLSQIDYAINNLNSTHGGTDPEYATVNPAFSSVKSYTKVRWKRALIDPKGNPTTGVVYYNDKQSGFGNNTGYDREIASCAWDNYKYFNIYIMNDLYANNVINNSGICWYPNTAMSDSGVARMVYNYVYFGQGGSSYNNLEFNKTFTHETGHWLNLYHTFDGNDCNGPGDYVADTPPVDSAAMGCNAIRCGGLINGENFMDYNSTCYKNFTIGQNTRMETALMDPTRFPIWQYDNLVATGVLSPSSTDSCVVAHKFFSYSKTILNEDDANDGSIEIPPVEIYACAGLQFVMHGATLNPGTDYTITNVPPGLSASVVTASDGKSATLTLSGNATNHLSANSITNMVLTFKDVAVVGGNVASIANYTMPFKIYFKDPWTYSCATPGTTTTSTSTWNWFETVGSIPRYYGLWYNAGGYYLENYGRGIITVGANSDNVVFLPAGTSIGPLSTWRAGGSEGVLYSSTYFSLNNTTGYIGFRMQAGTDYYYGWMKISVSSASGVSLLEYQYCNKPNTQILAGSSCNFPTTAVSQVANEESSLMIYPNPSTGLVTLANAGKKSAIIVYDITGRMVLETSSAEVNYIIDLKTRQPGIYFIKVMSDGKSSFNKVVIFK